MTIKIIKEEILIKGNTFKKYGELNTLKVMKYQQLEVVILARVMVANSIFRGKMLSGLVRNAEKDFIIKPLDKE